MADNTELDAGTGGDTIRTEDKSGIKTPVTLIDVGGTGAESLWAGAVTTGSERAEDAAHSSGHTGNFVLVVRADTAAATGTTDGDYCALVVDSTGRLWCNVSNTVATTVGGDALTALQLIDDVIYTDDAAFTPGTSKVLVVGAQADDASTDSVDEGDAGGLRMTLDRKLITNPQPHSAGGLSIFRSIDLDEGTLEVVKNAPGCLYGMWVTNNATTTRWIKFYDATSGTAGTGTPVITIGIPGNSSDDVSGLFSSGHGIMFATGICVGAVTGVADNDTGAPSANDVVINLFYK
jgi:hypothetical protein